MNIEGWCNPEMDKMLAHLDAHVHPSGGAYEIGVHHGKMFIMLNKYIRKEYQSYAVDVFEDQSLNVDRSGKGDYHIFRENLEKAGLNENVIIVRTDSLDPGHTPLPYGARYFSVDGGHTAIHVLNDLRIAEKVLHNHGIVFVDDFINVGWLGVVEGTCRYLQSGTLVPFCAGFNKLMLCRLGFHAKYLALMKEYPSRNRVRRFFGHDVVSLIKEAKQ